MLQKISTDLGGLKTDIQTLKGDVNELKTDTQGVKQNTADILEIVNFIKDNAAAKDDANNIDNALNNFRVETGQNFNDVKQQLKWMEAELEDIKKKLQDLEERTKDDDDVVVKEVVNLKQRVQRLENYFSRFRQRITK